MIYIGQHPPTSQYFFSICNLYVTTVANHNLNPSINNTILIKENKYENSQTLCCVRYRGLFGLIYGSSVGLGMGYGTYAVITIPYILALSWFRGTMAEAVVGGALIGLIHRRK